MYNYIIQRIESKYVADDCVQVMFPYKDELYIPDKYIDEKVFKHKDYYIARVGFNSILEEQGIYMPPVDFKKRHYFNSYTEDSRRFLFPYSNIPVHNSIKNFRLVKNANVIFDFDKVYLVVIDGKRLYTKALKDGNQAVIFTSTNISMTENVLLDDLNLNKIRKTINPHVLKLLNFKIKISELKKAEKVDYVYAFNQIINDEIEKYDNIDMDECSKKEKVKSKKNIIS